LYTYRIKSKTVEKTIAGICCEMGDSRHAAKAAQSVIAKAFIPARREYKA
jgi:hypothetical protein